MLLTGRTLAPHCRLLQCGVARPGHSMSAYVFGMDRPGRPRGSKVSFVVMLLTGLDTADPARASGQSNTAYSTNG